MKRTHSYISTVYTYQEYVVPKSIPITVPTSSCFGSGGSTIVALSPGECTGMYRAEGEEHEGELG